MMKSVWKVATFKVLGLIILGGLVVGAGTPAHAVPPTEVLRSATPQVFTGLCCFSWFETVKVSEPATPLPVIVRWSTDYVGGAEIVGLSMNGGPCLAFGPSSLYISGDGNPVVATRTFHWVVFPSDGPPGNALHKGVNTFTLCGGGQFFATQSITILNNTLSARISE